MIELMHMDDAAPFGMVRVDQLEWRDSRRAAMRWRGMVDAWYGNDYNKVWLKTEGERIDGRGGRRAEAALGSTSSRDGGACRPAFAHDFGEGPSRTWAAFGVQGLAPYWFEVEATAYVGEEGRTAARFSAEYDMLLTQRLILQPKLEFNLYGKDDRSQRHRLGLTDAEARLAAAL